MAVLGTTTEQPYFYSQRMAQTGQALGAFMDAFRQRKAEKEEREKEEIAQAFKAIASMPELADTWGSEIERKYAQRYPEVPQILAVVRQRHRLAQELPEAKESYYGALQGLESDYAAQQERVARMPDQSIATLPLNPFMPSAPMPFALPNPDKAAAQRSLSQVRPELFPLDALGKLPPRKRDQARVALKAEGLDLPDQTTFDPFSHLSEKSKGMYAVERGYVPPDSGTAAIIRGEGGLELTAEEKEKQGFQQQERKARETQQEEQLKERHRLQVERIELQNKLRAAADQRQLAGQKEIIDYRTSRKGDGGGKGDSNAIPWKAIVSDSKTAAKDWDARRKNAVQGLEGKPRAAAEAKFLKENGKRPVVVPEVAARRIARAAREKGLDGSEADEAIVDMSSTYMAERAAGTGDMEALNRAIGKSKAPEPKPAPGTAQRGSTRLAPRETKAKPIFTEVKDQEARAWAVEEYMARVEAGESADSAKAAVDVLLKQYGKVK